MNQHINLEPNVQQAVPFFAVTNLEESLRFYIDGLGFSMADKWIEEGKVRWCRLELGVASVMLQESRKDGYESWTPDGKVGVGVSIYFICKDALAIYRDITSRGIESKRPFVGNAMWVTSLSDPDGYSLSFESPTNALEGTEYSDQED